MKFKIALTLAVFIGSASADIITATDTVGGMLAGVGVDVEGAVAPDGTVTYGFAQMSDSAPWTVGASLSFVPQGSVISSATFVFSEPIAFSSPEGLEPELTADTFATLSTAGFTEDCSGNLTWVTLTGQSTTFTPCGNAFTLDTLFTGNASIDLTGATWPGQPGTYENGLLLSVAVNYTLTVDYTEASGNNSSRPAFLLRAPAGDPTVPEPGYGVVTGCFLLAGAIRKRGGTVK